MPTMTTEELTERRGKLSAQLTELQSQHAGIAQDVADAEEARKTAFRAGEDTALVTERLKHRQGELDDSAWKLEQVAEQLAEVDTEIRRRAPHEALDRDLAAHVTDLEAFDQLAAKLDGAHRATVDKVINAVIELTGLITSVRQRHAELANQTAHLQATVQRLDRTEAVPGPPSWDRPLEHALRGTGLWNLYLITVQQRPAEVAKALGFEISRYFDLKMKAEVRGPFVDPFGPPPPDAGVQFTGVGATYKPPYIQA